MGGVNLIERGRLIGKRKLSSRPAIGAVEDVDILRSKYPFKGRNPLPVGLAGHRSGASERNDRSRDRNVNGIIKGHHLQFSVDRPASGSAPIGSKKRLVIHLCLLTTGCDERKEKQDACEGLNRPPPQDV